MILWIILAKRLPRIAGSQPALPCRSFSVAGPRGRVTRRQHREESRYFSQKAVTVQGTPSPRLRRLKEGMARVFAVQVQILLNITSVAVQILLRAGNKSRYTKD